MADALGDMPLHDITEHLGEHGLRDRFEIERRRLPDGAYRVYVAYELASELHRDEWRSNDEPYINHVLRVAIRIMHHYGVRDPDVICAAVLHDAVEDHAPELVAMAGPMYDGADFPIVEPYDVDDRSVEAIAYRADRALTLISKRFGWRVADLVRAVTNPPYVTGRDVREQYREHVVASLDANPWARVIKLSDFTDNAVGIVYTRRSKAERIAPKYYPLVDDLRELAARPDTPLPASVRARIDKQLVSAERRLRAVLAAEGTTPDATPNTEATPNP